MRFYGPVNPMGSCQARSVYLMTQLLGRFSPLSGLPVLCTFFRQKLTTALLESVEGREWLQKILHDQSPQKNVADLGGGWTRKLLVSNRTAHPTEPPRLANDIINSIWNKLTVSYCISLNPGLAEPGYALLWKQCRSRSVGFSEANWSGSALFVIKYINLYQQSSSSTVIGWKLELGMAS